MNPSSFLLIFFGFPIKKEENNNLETDWSSLIIFPSQPNLTSIPRELVSNNNSSVEQSITFIDHHRFLNHEPTKSSSNNPHSDRPQTSTRNKIS